MKLCEKHWTMMREAVVARGMWHLVSASGEEALKRTLTADMAPQGPVKAEAFDPLLSMTWMVYGKALSVMPYLLFAPSEEEKARGCSECPICEVVRRHPVPCPNGCTNDDVEQGWVNGPADAALKYATETLKLEVRPVA